MISRLGDAMYRLLLRLFPRAMRQHRGEDMAACFAAQRRAARRRPDSLIALWCHAILDAIKHGLIPRMATHVGSWAPRLGLASGVQALRHASAGLKRSPGYVVAVVFSFAFGVGANTSVFAIADRVMYRPLPFADASSLLTVGITNPTGVSWTLFSPDLSAWTERATTIRTVALFSHYQAAVSSDTGSEYAEGAFASSSLASMFEHAPRLGRWFDARDMSPGAPRVIVVSDALWRRHFSAASDLGSATLRLNGDPVAVVGVMPAGAVLPLQAQFWLPMRSVQGQLIARPANGATLPAIQAELTQLSPSVSNLKRQGRNAEVMVAPLREQLFGAAKPAVGLLFGVTALLLLIACANVANLSLARALDRRREWSVRAALGASRRSLAALVLAENVTLIGAGGILGVIAAYSVSRVFTALAPLEVALPNVALFDWRSVFFAAVAIALSVLIASLGPAFAVTHADLQPTLSRSNGRLGRGPESSRLRRVMVAGQVAIALVLMIGCGLLVRSVIRLTRVDLGFDPRGVATTSVHLTNARYRQGPRTLQLLNGLTERASAIPGVEGVAVGPLPLVGGLGTGLREGFNALIMRPTRGVGNERPPMVWVKYVNPGYFDVFRIRLRAGRGFLPTDDETTPAVALLNGRAAAVLFPESNAMGQTLVGVPKNVSQGKPITVVGITEDVRQRDVTLAAEPEIFVPVAQQELTMSGVTVSVLTSGDPQSLTVALRQILRELDPELATTRLGTMTGVVDASLARYRFMLQLLGASAVLALVLAMVGLYAIVSYLVGQRTREIGIRIALGARRSNVMILIGREATSLIAIGTALGTGLAIAFGGSLRSFLFEVGPHDPMVFAAAPVFLAAAGVLAAFVPVRRAIRVDPKVALQAE